MGSVRQLTGHDGQNPVRRGLRLFGTTTTTYSTGTSLFGYTGEQTDSTGLINLRARMYDPKTGAFLSKDPVDGSLGSLLSRNGYGYAHADPVNLSDPSGQCVDPLSFLLCAAAFGAVAGGTIDAGLQITNIAFNGRALSSFNWGQTVRTSVVGGVGGAFGAGVIGVGGAIAAGVGLDGGQ